MHYRDRNQRPRAYNEPGHAHELTFSCFHQLPLLSKERTCTWLAEAIEEARRDLNFDVWCYVFMPNHVHMIAYPLQVPYDTSDWLKAIKEPVARKAIGYLRKESPDWLTHLRHRPEEKEHHHFWQVGRGYDRNIERTSTLLEMIDYIHLNPVRKKLVEFAIDWKWSSAGWLQGCASNCLKPNPIPADWLCGG